MLFTVFIVPGVLVAIVNLIKDGLNTWVPEILKTSFGYGDSLSLTLTLVLPLVGMGGSALALFMHKKFDDYLTLSGVLYLAVTAAIFGITAILRSGSTGAARGRGDGGSFRLRFAFHSFGEQRADERCADAAAR